MKNIYQFSVFFVFMFLSLSPKNSNSQWVEKWVSTYTNTGTTNEYPMDMVLDENDNVYITGYGYNGFDKDFLILKYDINGNLVWNNVYSSPGNVNDVAYSIDIDSEGNSYICGASNGTPTKLILVKYNSDGVEQWAIDIAEGGGTYEGTNSNYIFELKIGPDDKIYVSGQLMGVNSSYDVILAKVNKEGTVEWKHIYNPANLSDHAANILFDSKGNIILGCSSKIIETWSDFALMSFDTSGALKWSTRFTRGSQSPDYVFDMVIDNQDNIYMTGQTDALSCLTVKFTSQGELLWDKSVSHQMYDMNALIDNSGNIIIGGRKYNFYYNWDYFLVKYNPTGELIFYELYNSPGNWQDVGFAVAVDFRDNIYLTGGIGTMVQFEQDYGTLLYDKNGNLVLIERYNSPRNGFDIAKKISFDSYNDLVVMGHTSDPEEGFNIVTIKYTNVVNIENISSEVPDRYELSQNYPNPFNPATSIKFALPKNSLVTLKVYDLLGREIATLVNQELNAGTFEYSFDGSKLTSGVYFYRFDAGEFNDIKKMLLVK